ncbi:type II toxin-antitoxin system RelE/ParE family toxin [Nioella sp. MMSF_3534]|uniref:type II toxin-antitoxin system RelE/ParE family toxin n=1 Tax=Nioella sp. MMSF_3534 TaxID=3046720 RepID=UPI00273E122D|nr:type II toxin-antitoxin system RelE/ParE family toxin [Nioella sp. MMSF_3534]
MVDLVWLPEAQDDLRRLYEFIAPHSEEAAARAMMTLVTAAETLLDFPQKGRPWQPDRAFRELSVSFGAGSYVIRYREYADQVVIVRIWHAREER